MSKNFLNHPASENTLAQLLAAEKERNTVLEKVVKARPNLYTATKTTETDTDGDIIDDYFAAAERTPMRGDVFVVTTTIDGAAYEQSAYSYTGTAWQAMTGNVDADKVILTEDIVMAGDYTQVGNQTKEQDGTATIAAKGKSVAQLFDAIFTKHIQPTITAQPALAEITTAFGYWDNGEDDGYGDAEAGSVEAGTKLDGVNFAPVKLDPGSYTYDETTGVVATNWQIDRVTDADTTSIGSYTAAVWWLRSPVLGNTRSAWYVYPSGDLYYNLVTSTYGVRPAFILDSKYSVSSSGFVAAREAAVTAKSLGAKAVGDVVKLNANGAAANFVVVQQGKPSDLYDDSCDGTWLLAENIYTDRKWHTSATNDYANSDINTWLNGDFLALLDADIQAIVKQVKLPYQQGNGKTGSVKSGEDGLTTKVFLLSAMEVGVTGYEFASYAPTDGALLSYFEAGKGDTAKAKRLAKGNNIISCSVYDDDGYTIGDEGGTNTFASLKFRVTVTYSAGNVAKDNVGAESSPTVQIAAGTTTAETAAFTVYRAYFYGATTDKPTLDSAYIRGLTKSAEAYAPGTVSISVAAGAQRVAIACIATATGVTKVTNAAGEDITASFTQSTVAVEGANGYTAKDYKVWAYEPAAAYAAADTLTVTLG